MALTKDGDPGSEAGSDTSTSSTSSDSGTSSGGISGGGGGVLPDWIYTLRPLVAFVDFLVKFAQAPVKYIRRTVIGIVLGWIITVVQGGVGAVLSAGQAVADSVASAVSSAASVPLATLEILFGGGASVHTSLVSAATGLGLAAPAATVVVVAVELFALFWVLDAVIQVSGSALSGVPVLGSIASLLVTLYNLTKGLFARILGVFL